MVMQARHSTDLTISGNFTRQVLPYQTKPSEGRFVSGSLRKGDQLSHVENGGCFFCFFVLILLDASRDAKTSGREYGVS